MTGWLGRAWAKGFAWRVALVVAGFLLFPVVILGALLALAYRVIALVDRRGRLSERSRWTAAAVVVVMALAIFGSLAPRSTPVATPSGGPAKGTLTVTSPASGSMSESDTITVLGTAPAGAEVVWDIPFRQDQRTVAVDGRWSIVVTLTEGINRLTFRLGTDTSTALTLVLEYRPSTAVSSPQPTATANATATTVTVTPKPLATPPIVTLADKVGDFVDENGDSAPDGPAYQDIVSSVVKVDAAGNLIVSIETAGAAPTSWDPVKTEIVYGYFVETTGDDTPDYQILLQNDFDNRWTASVSEIATGQTLSGDRFPGYGSVLGSRASIRLDMATIGSPRMLKIATFTQSIVYPNPQSDPFTYVQRDDAAPDHQFPEDSPDWIVFEVPT